MLTFLFDENSYIAVELGHFPHPLDSPLGLEQRTEDTGNTDDGDSKGVIVVIIQGPEYDRGDLEYVEWVKNFVDQ
jgi:hypothetical protein